MKAKRCFGAKRLRKWITSIKNSALIKSNFKNDSVQCVCSVPKSRRTSMSGLIIAEYLTQRSLNGESLILRKSLSLKLKEGCRKLQELSS